ncbi:MAG: hypothetical protein JO247_18190 [Chloroflexi bacterium]|nr:hypothetical protein [Chloroflexota bacterium]
MSYAAQVAGWHDFFIAVAAAAATLVGLLFVGLSLHLRVVVTRQDVRALARATLATFGLLLIASICLLTPETQPNVPGSELVAFAGFNAVLVLRLAVVNALRRSEHHARRVISVRLTVLRYGLLAVTYALVGASGVLLLTSNIAGGLELMVPASAIGLSVSLCNTWDLLVTVGASQYSSADGS